MECSSIPTPISFQNGDVLGVYQPNQDDSTVLISVLYDANASTILIESTIIQLSYQISHFICQ